MEGKEMSYNRILEYIKDTEPILNGSEELTDRVMQRVMQTVACTGRIRVWRISGILSGVAASALICLLAYETWKYPVSPVEHHSRNETSWAMPTAKTYPQNISELNMQEKEKIIENVVKGREAQRMRKERMSASVMTRHRIAKSY